MACRKTRTHYSLPITFHFSQFTLHASLHLSRIADYNEHMYSLRSYDLTQAADVAANQRGEISPRQRLAFDEVARVANRPALIMIAIIAILFALPIMLLWQTPGSIGDKLSATVVVIAFVAAIIIVPFLRERAQSINHRQEILNGQIVQAAGEVRWQFTHAIARTTDRQLQSIYGPLTLPPGNYRFYYLPKSGGLLSAEKIGQPQ
jgi:hypothetical protein